MPVHDEIWSSLPPDRPLDGTVVDFAVGSVKREAGARGAAVRALDLGCGDGSVGSRIAAAGAHVTGVEPSPTARDRARAAHPDLDVHAPLADGSLPFGDSAFEVVVCLHVLEHVADVQTLLSEARRVLVPRGSLEIAVPWHGRIESALTALTSFERRHDPLEPVLRFYTPRSLGTLLEALGFDVVALSGAGGLPLARRTLLCSSRRGAP